MAERHRTILRLLVCYGSCGSVLGNCGARNHDECHSEDSQCGEHQTIHVANLSLSDVGDQQTGQDDHSGTHQRVERATDLDQLVTLVTAATEFVKHRVYDDVEHTHRETCHESTEQIDTEATYHARDGLNTYADETHRDSDQSGLFVAELREHIAGGNTHHGISDEVSEHAESTHPVSYAELMFQYVAHRRSQVGHERDHTEKEDHHDDGQHVTFLFFHNESDYFR